MDLPNRLDFHVVLDRIYLAEMDATGRAQSLPRVHVDGNCIFGEPVLSLWGLLSASMNDGMRSPLALREILVSASFSVRVDADTMRVSTFLFLNYDHPYRMTVDILAKMPSDGTYPIIRAAVLAEWL